MDVVQLNRAMDRLARTLAYPSSSSTRVETDRVSSQRVRGRLPRAWPGIPSIAVGTAVLLTGVAAAVLMAYALPAETDWSRVLRQGNGHHDLGWFTYTFGFTYFHWQGRWASCALESLILPNINPLRAYPLLLTAFAGVDLLGLYVACRWFVRGGERALAASMTLGAAALLWAGMPSIAEGMYWALGAIENVMVLSLAAMLLVAISNVKVRRFDRWMRLAVYVALAAAVITVCGFHELYGSMLWLALGTGCVAAMVSKTGRAHLWAITWASASVGLAIVILAPGNAHRLDVDANPHSRQFVYDVRLAAGYLWNFGRAWIFDPKLLAVSLWVAVSPTLEMARTAWPTAKRFSWRWAFPTVGAAMVSLGFFLPCYAFGNSIPGRTLSGAHIVFVACWLLTVYAWTRQLDEAPKSIADSRLGTTRSPSTALHSAKLLFAAGLLMSGNLPMAARDLSVRVRPWHAMAEQRYAAIAKPDSKNQRVVLSALPPQPWSLLAGEISDNPRDWHNLALSDYFKLCSVKRATTPGDTATATIEGEPEPR